MLFGLRLDETNTHVKGGFFTVGGAVGTTDGLESLEKAWSRKLSAAGVDEFHLKNFDARQEPYYGWSDFKARRFEDALHKIIKKHTVFRCSVSVDSAVHIEIKDRMRGVRGFRGDSDFSLCLRYLMFWICEQLVQVDADATLSVIVEDGPYSAGAADVYQRVAAMQGKWKPAKHAHRLVGFGSRPKGCLRALEAADLIVGREHQRLANGRASSGDVLSVTLNRPRLEQWYEGMMQEKELRRAHGQRPRGEA